MRRLSALVGLPADQMSTTLISAALLFLLISSQYVVKPVRNSVFVQRVGADHLPYVYIGARVYVFFASNLLLFSWLLRHDSVATSAVFYMWTSCIRS